jgi:hypothetical protein
MAKSKQQKQEEARDRFRKGIRYYIDRYLNEMTVLHQTRGKHGDAFARDHINDVTDQLIKHMRLAQADLHGNPATADQLADSITDVEASRIATMKQFS